MAWRLWREYSDALARRTFRFSIWHLSLLFAALLLDHYSAPGCSRHEASEPPHRPQRIDAGRPGACSAEKPAFKGIDISGAEYARDLALPDASGKPRTLADFKGKVTVCSSATPSAPTCARPR